MSHHKGHTFQPPPAMPALPPTPNTLLLLPPSQVPLSSFRFLTRLHYCASDSDTWGPNAEWGEHEVDYILFIRAKVTLQPNPEEVDDVR